MVRSTILRQKEGGLSRMINIISYYEDTILYSPEKVHPYSVWGRKPQRGELPPLGLLSPSFSTLLKQDISTLQGLGHFYFALTLSQLFVARTQIFVMSDTHSTTGPEGQSYPLRVRVKHMNMAFMHPLKKW